MSHLIVTQIKDLLPRLRVFTSSHNSIRSVLHHRLYTGVHQTERSLVLGVVIRHDDSVVFLNKVNNLTFMFTSYSLSSFSVSTRIVKVYVKI